MTLSTADEEARKEETTSEQLLHVGKSVRLSAELPVFDEAFYAWKKSYWKERIKGVKNVVAPMVDQR